MQTIVRLHRLAPRALAFLLLAFFAAGTLACGNMNRKPRYDIAEPLEIVPFKRFAKHESRDYIHLFKHEAYSPVEEPLDQRLSPSQLDVLQRHGQPQYIRTGFTAHSGEIVDEWAYWDREVIVQFIQRQLVWEGPLTDMDRVRIRYGYPRRRWSQDTFAGARRDIWDYQGFLLDNRGMLVTFTDEQLVTQDYY